MRKVPILDGAASPVELIVGYIGRVYLIVHASRSPYLVNRQPTVSDSFFGVRLPCEPVGWRSPSSGVVQHPHASLLRDHLICDRPAYIPTRRYVDLEINLLSLPTSQFSLDLAEPWVDRYLDRRVTKGHAGSTLHKCKVKPSHLTSPASASIWYYGIRIAK